MGKSNSDDCRFLFRNPENQWEVVYFSGVKKENVKTESYPQR
jgi:hypothetical protein